MKARHSVGIRNHLAYNPYRTSTIVLSRDEFYIHAVISGSFCLYLLLVGTNPWSFSEIIELGGVAYDWCACPHATLSLQYVQTAPLYTPNNFFSSCGPAV